MFIVEPISFTEPLKNITVAKLGTDAAFECSVNKENARVQWLKDGREIALGGKYTAEVDGKSYRLKIRNVTGDDSAEYAIVVKGHRSSAWLDVQVKPNVTNESDLSKTVILTVGEAASINVPFSAYPEPKVTWKLNNMSIVGTRFLRVDTILDKTHLIISHAERMHSGEYSVMLENSAGSVHQKIKVIVLGEFKTNL